MFPTYHEHAMHLAQARMGPSALSVRTDLTGPAISATGAKNAHFAIGWVSGWVSQIQRCRMLKNTFKSIA